MLQAIKKRSKSKAFWVSLATMIPLGVFVFGVDTKVIPDNYEILVKAILNVLVVAGICSDPTTENPWYGDDKEKTEKEV